MITQTRIDTDIVRGYSLVSYKLDGAWRQLDRPFKDPKDAKRAAKSLMQSQGFNGLTDGGLR